MTTYPSLRYLPTSTPLLFSHLLHAASLSIAIPGHIRSPPLCVCVSLSLSVSVSVFAFHTHIRFSFLLFSFSCNSRKRLPSASFAYAPRYFPLGGVLLSLSSFSSRSLSPVRSWCRSVCACLSAEAVSVFPATVCAHATPLKAWETLDVPVRQGCACLSACACLYL